MIPLDTNVLIYAFETDSPFTPWARQSIAEAVAEEGVMVNPVILAELCVGDAQPDRVTARIRSWGVETADLPASAGSCLCRGICPVPEPLRADDRQARCSNATA